MSCTVDANDATASLMAVPSVDTASAIVDRAHS